MVRLAGVVSAAVLLAACAKTVDGTARTAPGAGPVAPSPTAAPADNSLASILPDTAQWSSALGFHVHLEGMPARVGGVEQLGRQDVLGEWSERECLGVVQPLLQSVFDGAPVRAVVGSFVSGVTVGAVELTSPTDAQTLFKRFADRWQQCQGKTVVQHQSSDTFIQDITNVAATDTVLSATIEGRVPPNPPQPTERALGMTASCIVDVQAPGNSQPANAPVGDNLAVSLVKLMQSKASAAKC